MTWLREGKEYGGGEGVNCISDGERRFNQDALLGINQPASCIPYWTTSNDCGAEGLRKRLTPKR